MSGGASLYQKTPEQALKDAVSRLLTQQAVTEAELEDLKQDFRGMSLMGHEPPLTSSASFMNFD